MRMRLSSLHSKYLYKYLSCTLLWASQVAQWVKNSPAMQRTGIRSLDLEDSLEEGMATHSSIPAWRIPWIEESGGLQSTGSQSRTGVSDLSTYTYPHPKRHSEQKGPTTDQSCKGDPACRRQWQLFSSHTQSSEVSIPGKEAPHIPCHGICLPCAKGWPIVDKLVPDVY